MIAFRTARRALASTHLAGPLVLDVMTAAAVAGFAVVLDVFGPDVRTTGALVWDVALAVPLIIRRRSPALCAAVLGALCLVQWFADVRAIGDLAFLVALYTIGSRESRRWVQFVAAAVAELGAVLAVMRWQNNLSTLLLLTGTVSAALILGLYVRTRRAYLASVIERALTAERDRDSSNRIAVAEERVRISREMHDVVAHGLSVMISLNDGAAVLAAPGGVRDAVTQAAEVGRQALEEMQLLLGVLRSPEPPQLVPLPGIAQLPDLVTTARAAGLSVRLGTTGEMDLLPRTAQLTVYRIVQEGLTNVLKHGLNVSRVTVEVVCEHPLVSVAITNDGDVVRDGTARRIGHGLTGMRERAELYGGVVDAKPIRGGGWTVSARLFPGAPSDTPSTLRHGADEGVDRP